MEIAAQAHSNLEEVPELRRRTIMKFAERMDRFGEGIFSRLAELKRQKLEAGENVVDLSIGAPNIPPGTAHSGCAL